MAPDTKTMFSCVDSRHTNPRFGTPGGDMSELVIGIQVYLNLTNQLTSNGISINNIKPIFKNFIETECSANRPFYYHSATGKVQAYIKKVGASFPPVRVNIPSSAPSNAAEKNMWLTEFPKPDYQGCGHIYTMLKDTKKYGLTANVLETSLQAFLESYWEASSKMKASYNIEVLLGPLIGRAVSIVQNGGPGCKGYSPKVPAADRGSQTFVYHGNAVAAFRSKVLTPFFVKMGAGKFTAAAFQAEVDRLANLQLQNTLDGLPPANQVNFFLVNVTATGVGAASSIGLSRIIMVVALVVCVYFF